MSLTRTRQPRLLRSSLITRGFVVPSRSTSAALNTGRAEPACLSFFGWTLVKAREATNTRSGGRGGGRAPGRDGGPRWPRGRVEECGADGPSRRQLAGRMATHVSLHGSQAGAASPAQRAAVGSSPVCPQVLGHGREVPGTLRTEATGEGLLSCKWRRKPEKEEMGGRWPS